MLRYNSISYKILVIISFHCNYIFLQRTKADFDAFSAELKHCQENAEHNFASFSAELNHCQENAKGLSCEIKLYICVTATFIVCGFMTAIFFFTYILWLQVLATPDFQPTPTPPIIPPPIRDHTIGDWTLDAFTMLSFTKYLGFFVFLDSFFMWTFFDFSASFFEIQYCTNALKFLKRKFFLFW